MSLALIDRSKELDREMTPPISYLRFQKYGAGEGTCSEFFANAGVLPNSPLHWLNPFPVTLTQEGIYSSSPETANAAVPVPRTFEQQIINSYSEIPQTKAIYLSRYGIEYQLTIFVSAEKLDDKILDALLEKEFALVPTQEQDIVAVTYIPGLDNRDIPLISPSAKLIFYRR